MTNVNTGSAVTPLLAVAGFMVVTTEFILVGILPLVARDLDIGIAAAGSLVTLFAFTVALAGPPLTALLAGYERRSLFTAILLLFAAANLLAAAAPNLAVLAIARILPALGLPVFWSLATVTVAERAAPEASGAAVARLFVGISLASVAGLPLGTLIADLVGWRIMFAVFAVASLLTAIALRVALPRLPGAAMPIMAQVKALRSGLFLAHLGLGALAFTVMFTGYTYLAEALSIAGLDGRATSFILIGFGAAGLVGNAIAGRLVDRSPLVATGVTVALGALATLGSILLLDAGLVLFVGLGLWGAVHAAGFLVNTVRVTNAGSAAPALAAALNASLANVGIGTGALLGGQAIAFGGPLWVALATIATAGVALTLAGWIVARSQADKRKCVQLKTAIA